MLAQRAYVDYYDHLDEDVPHHQAPWFGGVGDADLGCFIFFGFPAYFQAPGLAKSDRARKTVQVIPPIFTTIPSHGKPVGG